MSIHQNFAEMVLPLTALMHTKDDRVDDLLRTLADKLSADGLNVIGYVQGAIPGRIGCCADFYLEDLNDGKRFAISQQLGKGSRGCRLDPQQLAESTQRMLSQIKPGVDILLLNRFGHSESEGRGFRPLIEKALEHDIPVLVAVRDLYFDAWQTFTEGYSTVLSQDEFCAKNWYKAIIAHHANSQITMVGK